MSRYDDDEILDDIPDMPEDYDIPDMPEDYDISPDELDDDVSDEFSAVSASSSDDDDIDYEHDPDLASLGLNEDSSEDYISENNSDNPEEAYDDSYERASERNSGKKPSGKSRRRSSDTSEEDWDTSEYYGIEEERPRTPKKIVPKEQEKTRSLRLKRYKDQNLARFSNIYMLAGMLIGVAVFYFLVSPEIKDDYQEKLRALETSYNQTISTKNNEIENLRLERDSLNSKNTEYETNAAQMQTTIDNLAAEVEMLKKTVENSGLSVSVPDSATVTDASATTSVIQRNEAAERNNANVIGISGYAVEDIIDNE